MFRFVVIFFLFTSTPLLRAESILGIEKEAIQDLYSLFICTQKNINAEEGISRPCTQDGHHNNGIIIGSVEDGVDCCGQ